MDSLSEILIYCDESCHILNDHLGVLLLGAVWCPSDRKEKIHERIKEIKEKHGLSKHTEIKWGKISDSKVNLYIDLVDYFFDTSDLHFRSIIVKDKNSLNHDQFNQTHDDFYFKMYYLLLRNILESSKTYKVFIDIKDTLGGRKTKKLHEILSNNLLDFSKEIIREIQIIRSHESQLIQLADLLTGAISYSARGMATSQAKLKVLERIAERLEFSISESSSRNEDKFNIFYWDANYRKSAPHLV